MDGVHDPFSPALLQDGQQIGSDGISWDLLLRFDGPHGLAEASEPFASLRPYSRNDYRSGSSQMDWTDEVDVLQGSGDPFTDSLRTDDVTTMQSRLSPVINRDLDDAFPLLHEERFSSHVAAQPTQRQKKIARGYQCGECAMAFDRRCDLNKHHNRLHLAEAARPFPCQGCSKRFCDRKDLNRHSSSQHHNLRRRQPCSSPVVPLPTKRRRIHGPGPTNEPGQAPIRPNGRSPETQLECDLRSEEHCNSQSAREAFDHFTALMSDLQGKEDHSQTQSNHHPCEMIAIRGAFILVTSRDLVLDLSSDFNPKSDFKLRSILVPHQRAKVELSLAQTREQLRQEKVEVVFVDRRNSITVQESGRQILDQLIELMEMVGSLIIGRRDHFSQPSLRRSLPATNPTYAVRTDLRPCINSRIIRKASRLLISK